MNGLIELKSSDSFSAVRDLMRGARLASDEVSVTSCNKSTACFKVFLFGSDIGAKNAVVVLLDADLNFCFMSLCMVLSNISLISDSNFCLSSCNSLVTLDLFSFGILRRATDKTKHIARNC